MNVIKTIKSVQRWTLILLFIIHGAVSIDKELPSFIELPPPIQYYTGESTIELKCNVWPSTAKVQFMVSSKKIWSNALNPSQNTLELNLIDRNIGDLTSPGKLRISNSNHLNNIQDQNIHCLTATDFATVLSRPFRVTRAGMSDFGGDMTIKSKTVKKSFLRGNVAIIDCWPPESHPRAEVKFNFNNVEIKEGGRYRIVHWSDGKRVSLLIHPAEQPDNGQYRCIATNPITKQTKLSSEIIDLTVEIPQTSITPSIIIPISGRASGPQHITARKGTNVTLFCIIRGAPPPQIQIYNYNNDLTTNPRYILDHEFGLLKIVDVKVTDSGSYMCNDKYITSSAVLKVTEPLNITTRPVNVILDNLSGSAKFNCVSSKPSIFVQWFFNGRPISAESNGTLHIQSVTVTNLGIYQCVAQDHEEWVSAAATLSIKSYNLISQPSVVSEVLVQPPVVQNIDKQEQVLSTPIGKRILDNMAVYVKWKVDVNGNIGDMTYCVLQYIYKGKTDSWSTAITIQEKIQFTYYYVTNRYVSPQNTYKFRVHVFFRNGHTVTSNWSAEVDFLNVGDISPVIEEASFKSPSAIYLRWVYQGVNDWPVDTFRILIRQAIVNATLTSKKFDKYFQKDVLFPTMNTTVDSLDPGTSYQVTIYGINEATGSRTITKYSDFHTVYIPPSTKTALVTTPSSTSRFLAGLVESWKSNKLLYGSLFALTGFLIVVMFLLLLLCLCRQRKFRNNKDTSSSHTFPYAYKEVSKTSSAANNNSSTLQIPGRMPQYSSQLALQQFQPNNGSIDRRTNDTTSQIHRAGSSHAMETASLVTDLYGTNYMHGIPMGHMQHPYQGFSTLPQGYPSNHHNRNNPQYQHFQQQQQHAHMSSIRRENPAGDSNRDSIIDQSMEMPSRNMSASQQQLMMLQSQEQQRNNMGYYNVRPGAMSPQMMMMMGSQQSLGPYGQYRRSNSQNYQGHMETPIAISATGHPVYQMDQVVVDSSGRPISPQYQYMQQQQTAFQSSVHPSMVDMYNQSHPYVRPSAADYSQHSLYHQQYRRSDSSDCGGTEPGYAYLPTNHGTEMIVSRQHTLNSLPEQPIDLGNNNNQQQQDSPGNTTANNGNNSSSGRHHHRRKTRNRQQNIQDNPSLERVQGNHGDLPPMLTPRSKMPYPDNPNIHRLSGHDMNSAECQDMSITDCNSESNATGENFDPPLQYSTHYDSHDPNDNDAAPNNSLLIENLPRIRDVSEYGIPINNNNHNQRSMKQQLQHQVPVPPLKTNTRHNPSNNGYNMECNPDYYSSATSSDRSGPSPPPKYAPSNVPLTRPEEVYMKNLYYHGDTHC